jgi:hypothetical protein
MPHIHIDILACDDMVTISLIWDSDKTMTDEELISRLIEGQTYISVATLKLKTGLNGHRIAAILKQLGLKRYSSGKTRRPIWVKYNDK